MLAEELACAKARSQTDTVIACATVGTAWWSVEVAGDAVLAVDRLLADLNREFKRRKRIF